MGFDDDEGGGSESYRGELIQTEEQANGGFRSNGARTAENGAIAVAASRAMQEVNASYAVARQFPRNELQTFANVMAACKRKGLAEVAEYEYKRGGTTITGPTIRLMEVLAQQWGNISSGFTELDRTNGKSTVMCYAVDLQTGYRSEKGFVVKHWRDTKGGGYALKDERDVYELIANQAMRRVRACIQACLPGDLVEAAVMQCRKTLKEGHKEPLEVRTQHMVAAFAEFQVTVPMLEAYVQSPLKVISENQFARLRRVYSTLRDGIANREDVFDVNAGSQPKPSSTAPQLEGAGPSTDSDQSTTSSSPSPAPEQPRTGSSAVRKKLSDKRKKREAKQSTTSLLPDDDGGDDSLEGRSS